MIHGLFAQAEVNIDLCQSRTNGLWKEDISSYDTLAFIEKGIIHNL